MSKYILGLDVSTSKIGYSILNDKQQLIECGVWKYKPDMQLENKAKLFINELEQLRSNYGTLDIFVEEPFIAFSGGRTTAVTMAKLQRFNGMCCFGIFHIFGRCPVLLSANQTRKAVGIKRKKGEDIKKKVIYWVKEKYPNDFHFDLTRHGNPKPGTDDKADAVIVGLAGIILNS